MVNIFCKYIYSLSYVSLCEICTAATFSVQCFMTSKSYSSHTLSSRRVVLINFLQYTTHTEAHDGGTHLCTKHSLYCNCH